MDYLKFAEAIYVVGICSDWILLIKVNDLLREGEENL